MNLPLKKKLKNIKGVISVVAVIIVSLMAVFILIVQNDIFHAQVQGNLAGNQALARNIAGSSIELLERQAVDLEPGFNSGTVNCIYQPGGEMEVEIERADLEEELIEWCQRLATLVPEVIDDEPREIDVKIALNIQGRNIEDATLNSDVCPGILFGENCYTVPLAGRGSAGERCDLYEPALGGNVNTNIEPALHGRNLDVDQADYSCNWNKLQMGSKDTSQAVVPLYYNNNNNQQTNKL